MTRPKPFTREEWQEMMSMTLHGPLPQKTLYRVYATVDYLFFEVEQLIGQLLQMVELSTKTDLLIAEQLKEIGRLNGALRILEKSAREADAGAVADMIAALISTNPRGMKSDVVHLDPADDLHVEGLDEVLGKKRVTDHNSPEGMALIRKLARERNK